MLSLGKHSADSRIKPRVTEDARYIVDRKESEKESENKTWWNVNIAYYGMFA